jgi:tungstate transport system substrate-binding protein
MLEALADAPPAALRLALERRIVRHAIDERLRARAYRLQIFEERPGLRVHGMILTIPMTRFLLAAALTVATACAPPADTLRIATTTSVDNSGLLEAILPAFTRDTGYRVHVIATGSGQAINLGRRGDVAMLITHEPIGERALFDDGLVRYYRKFMFNRFVIAGPPGDPARDESGTHVREQTLWAAAGVRPAGSLLIETGQGMASTLRVASERQSYVLTDEATLAQLAQVVAIGALFMRDDALSNTYAVSILTTTRPHRSPAAESLARWLAEGPARDLIAGFEAGGRPVFFPWPPDADTLTPESMPGAARR